MQNSDNMDKKSINSEKSEVLAFRMALLSTLPFILIHKLFPKELYF